MNKLGTVRVGGSNPVRIMGILNTSPESFYKKSVSIGKQKIVDAVHSMEEEGADFIDVGGMSTAPYLSTMISEKIEVARVINAVKIIQRTTNLPISVDTCRATVAKEVLELGVDIINDVTGLKYDTMMPKIIERYCPSLILCAYSKKIITGNQLQETKQLLKKSLEIAKSAKITRSKIVLDPNQYKPLIKVEITWVEKTGIFRKQKIEIPENLYLDFNTEKLIYVENKRFKSAYVVDSDPHKIKDLDNYCTIVEKNKDDVDFDYSYLGGRSLDKNKIKKLMERKYGVVVNNVEMILFPTWTCTIKNKKENKTRELLLDGVFGNSFNI